MEAASMLKRGKKEAYISDNPEYFGWWLASNNLLENVI